MADEAISVLLIEDNPADFRLIKEMLSEAKHVRFELAQVERLWTGMARLTREPADAVLLDLQLPDSQGLQTCQQARRHAPEAAIVVLTGQDDDELGMEVVRQGVQDYLVKGEVTPELLERSLRYAVERKRAQLALQQRAAELERSRTALHQQTHVLRSVLRSIPDGVVVVDPDGRVILANSAAERMCRFGPGEIPPVHWPRHYGLTIYRPDRSTPVPTDELPLSRARRGEVITGEIVFIRHSDAPEGVLLSVDATPLKNDEGVVFGGIGIFRSVPDSTDR